jgi:carboxymethylenebutenolidase
LRHDIFLVPFPFDILSHFSLRGAGFSLRELGLAWTKPHRLKRVPLGAHRENGYDVSALFKTKREENPMETIRTENITLKVADGTSMNAYVATPVEGAKAPGLLVFQEAFGVNAHIRDVTDRFAKQGYVAIAPELFHRTGPGFEGAYSNFPACMPHRQALTPDGLIADARAAFDWLQGNPRVLPNATASVGFCMGGRVSFLANSALPLKAAISFYGGGIAPALLPRAAQQHGPILFFWGALDSHIPKDHIRAIIDAMQEAKKTYVNVEFSDADHGFFCDARPSYKETAAKQAWELVLKFLATYMR